MDLVDTKIVTSAKFRELSLASTSSSVPVEVVTCSHLWTIHNFSLCCKAIKKNRLKSPNFSSRTNKQVQWYLTLYLSTEDEESEDKNDFMSIYVCQSNSDEVSGNAKCSILNSSYVQTHIKCSSFFKIDKEGGWGWRDFVRKSFLLQNSNVLLPDDKLTIFCEVEALINTSNSAKEIEFDIPSCSLLEDVGSLLQNEKFSDVTLSVAEKNFQVHKAILAARSPVFQAMFNHDLEEHNQNRVVITDMDDQVIKEMLRFIYTGEASNLEQIAADLLVAADKYALNRLKVICERELCLKLSIENVVQTLILADRHCAHQLKVKAIDFIKIHAKKVMETPEWEGMVQHPNLIEEILRLALFP